MAAWTKEECIQHFKEQEEHIREQMKTEEGEEYAHCVDEETLGGRFYDPVMVITSQGRVWSLRENGNNGGFRVPSVVNGYQQITTSTTGKEHNPTSGMYIHRLVANYFCDKELLNLIKEINTEAEEPLFDDSVGEDGYYKAIEVHHVNSKRSDNRAENLQFIYTKIHKVVTALRNRENENDKERKGAITRLKKVGLDVDSTEFDALFRVLIDSSTDPDNDLYGYIEKDPLSPRGYKMILKTKINFPRTTKEEEIPAHFERWRKEDEEKLRREEEKNR